MKMNSPRRQDEDELPEGMDSMEIDSDEEFIEITEDELLELVEESQGSHEDEETPRLDMAVTTFPLHQKSVFACDIYAEQDLAVSGGEDDLAYVWNINTGEVSFQCPNHTDSVTCAKFSHDGTLVATGDMKGLIQVWKISTKSKIWEFEVTELGWFLWHSKTNVLLAGTSTGDLWMWLIKSGNFKTFPSFGSSSICGELSPCGNQIASGYENGEVRIFDCKSGSLLQVFSGYKMHTEAITQVSWHKERPIIICSSMSGKAKILNTAGGTVVATYDFNRQGSEEAEEQTDISLEAASFCPALPQYSVTASLCGSISIWDLNTHVGRLHLEQECGTSKIVWHPSEPLCFAAGLDGVVRVYSIPSGDLKKEFTGHREDILDMALSSDGRTLITSSDDGTCKIFKIQ